MVVTFQAKRENYKFHNDVCYFNCNMFKTIISYTYCSPQFRLCNLKLNTYHVCVTHPNVYKNQKYGPKYIYYSLLLTTVPRWHDFR